jgi:hypothetical protein
MDQAIEEAEEIRYAVQSNREMLMRICKVNLYQGAKLTDAFKVWCYAVGACNEGHMNKVGFTIALDSPFKTMASVLKAVDDVKDGISSGISGAFGSIMDMGKKAVKVAEGKALIDVD